MRLTNRPAAILAGIVAVLAAVSPGRAQVALPDLPPDARPEQVSVYLEVAVVGTQLYVCALTDAFVWAWILMASDGKAAQHAD